MKFYACLGCQTHISVFEANLLLFFWIASIKFEQTTQRPDVTVVGPRTQCVIKNPLYTIKWICVNKYHMIDLVSNTTLNYDKSTYPGLG